MPVRMLIVDDSAVFRQGLRARLEAHDGWEVCGEATDGLEGVQKCRLLSPTLVIMDLAMPQMNGLEAASEISRESPGIPILLLTLFASPELAEQAQLAGISATLSKSDVCHLVPCIESVIRSERLSA